jgi:uncharacterized protein YehS (DUF1456 family)
LGCNSLISDHQISSIYYDGNLVENNKVVSICPNTNKKKSRIYLYENTDTCMLRRAVARSYHRSHPLCTDITLTGKVVKHEYFVLKDEFQGQKVASNIHKKEIQTYRACGFKEIQLDAAWDGLVVWKRQHFKFFRPIDESLIKAGIQRYLRVVKGMSQEDINNVIKKKPFNIDPSYLKDANYPDGRNDFKFWAYRHIPGLALVRMYKELS